MWWTNIHTRLTWGRTIQTLRMFQPEVNPRAKKNTNTTAYQEQIVVQKLTSEWNIHCNLVTYNIIGIVITLNLATYSDVYGRKLLFIPPIVGSILKNTLCSVGIYFNLNIEWFILFYAIEWCTGSWISLLSMAYSFIANLTEAGKPRSFIIGLLEGGMGIGAFLATILSGYLIKWTGGFFYPEVTSVILVGIELLIIMLILPETLHGSKKRNEVSFCQNMARVTECYKFLAISETLGVCRSNIYIYDVGFLQHWENFCWNALSTQCPILLGFYQNRMVWCYTNDDVGFWRAGHDKSIPPFYNGWIHCFSRLYHHGVITYNNGPS